MDQVRKNEIIAVVLFAISLFLLLSILTFSDQDLSFYTSAPNTISQNLTGIIGSYIGGFMLFFIGKAAYAIPVLVLVWGISRLLQIQPSKLAFKLIGTIVLTTALSGSLSMFAGSSSVMQFEKGGLIGSLVSGFLAEYLGRAGATVFILAMIILSVLIATEFLLLPIIVSISGFIKKLFILLKEKLVQKKSNFLENMAGTEKIKAAKEEIARKLENMRRQADEAKRAVLKSTAEDRSGRSVEPKIVKIQKSGKMEKRSVRVAEVSAGSEGEKIDYKLPGLDLLNPPAKENLRERDDALKKKAAILEKTLLEFGVAAKVVKINRGPVITMFELEPSIGTKVNRITSLSDNISLAMKSANIRIVAPIPGKGTIGIEVPNAKSEMVSLKDVLSTTEFSTDDSPLKMALGKDIFGTAIVTDLAKMPHLLIAGATGSGKTVCLNAIISSFLIDCTPDELKFLMIDPKRVELMMFEGLPHLVSPIVTNPKKVAAALNWVISEMERRYEIFAGKGVRNIGAYIQRKRSEEENLPYIVVIVDELADLMMVAQQDVEGGIMRIAQLSRAAGIHLILATQRPSVNVITGVIKANFPARISFKVASKVDSRTVLDANGAEKLLGRGDMLFMEPGETHLIRGQCSFVQDSEIRSIVKVINSQAEPQYIEQAVLKQETKTFGADQEKDELYMEAVEMVLETKQASASMIQRKFRVGYTRAARMIDIMEEEGIIGSHNGSKAREILINSVDEREERE